MICLLKKGQAKEKGTCVQKSHRLTSSGDVELRQSTNRYFRCTRHRKKHSENPVLEANSNILEEKPRSQQCSPTRYKPLIIYGKEVEGGRVYR